MIGNFSIIRIFQTTVAVVAFLCSGLQAEPLASFSQYFGDKVLSKNSEHFKVSWIDPRDGMIVPAALEHLEKAYADLFPLFGSQSGNSKIVPVEIFPDLKSFSAVSELPMARFKATGTIALTLDQRLMILSPRTLSSGYPWAVTLVHEFTHYLIREITFDDIPIWLHEGVAQIYQGYPYEKNSDLSPAQWGLFKKMKSKKKLLSLSTLKEPFPYRKDPEEAELAYIQALIFSKWLDKKCGVIELIRYAKAFQSIDKGLVKCTNTSFDQLEKKFVSEIMGSVVIPNSKAVDFYARDFSSENAFEREGQKLDRESRNFAELSQKLFEQGRFRPASREMEKAFLKTVVRPPSWSRHLALSYEKSGESKKARMILSELVESYPDDAAAWYLLALQEQKSSVPGRIWMNLMHAFFVNPFLDGLGEEIERIKSKNPNFAYSLLAPETQK